jgi:hypothetical protein
LRIRSSSAGAKVGSRVTSATRPSAASSRGVVTVIATADWPQPAPLSSDPPSSSAAAAISGPAALARALGEQVGGHRGEAGEPRRVELAAREHDQHRRHQRYAFAPGDDEAQAVRQDLLGRGGDRERARRGGRRWRLEGLRRRDRRRQQRDDAGQAKEASGAHCGAPSCT